MPPIQPSGSLVLRPASGLPQWQGDKDTVSRTQRICASRQQEVPETLIRQELDALHNILEAQNAFRYISGGPFAILVSKAARVLSMSPQLPLPTIVFGEAQYGYAHFLSTAIADRICPEDPPPPPPVPATDPRSTAVIAMTASAVLMTAAAAKPWYVNVARWMSGALISAATAASTICFGGVFMLYNPAPNSRHKPDWS